MSDIPDEPVLLLDNVTKIFGSSTAVHEVSLAVKSGEVFGFLGPNGAGKSTTIRMILDVLRPTAGTITLFGEPSTNTTATHRRTGFLSGDMVIDENLTGRQYLDFVANVYGKDCSQRIDKLAELLQTNLKVKIGNYSRGTKQKIGLIAAMMHKPDLLILDEPTSGFDPLVQETFAGLIQHFRHRGGAVFMSSHVLSEVQELCDRLAFIKDGKIISVTTTSELTAQAAKRIKIIADPGVLKAIHPSHLQGFKLEPSAHPYELHATYRGDVHSLLQLLAMHQLRDVTIREPELEELFMHYYTDEAPTSKEATKP